jgi:hypothetical protein
MDEDDWAYRYYLEEELMSILSCEEEYWRQQGRQNWLLKGDANTAYFHATANGRRRKWSILSLQSEEGEVFGQLAIQENIYKFYLDLMGSEEQKFLNLAKNCWNEDGSVSQEENEAFALTFTVEELEEVFQGTKTATVPGPDGLSVAFFKKFWPVLKLWVL